MIEVSSSAAVAAPMERAWELLSDTSRYAQWVDGTAAVTRTDGPASPGSTYDEVNPILGPWKAKTRWTVTEYEAPHRQVHRGEGLPLMSEFEIVMEVAPVGEGASEVTLTLRGTPKAGPLGGLFAKAMKPQVERGNRRSAQAFAELAARELG